MVDLINKFSTEVQENNGSVTVTYCHESLTGYCEYKIIEVNNRFKQRGLILINTDMGDVIEYMYQQGEIKDGDFNKIGSVLQDYSLSLIHDQASHLQGDDE